MARKTPLKFVFVESPFAGATEEERTEHLRYARAAMADCFERGEIPIASHLLYTQEGILDDTIPDERRKGMEAGFVLREFLGEAVNAGVGARRDSLGQVYPKAIAYTAVYQDRGISPGMQRGIEDSSANGVKVLFRSLPGWNNP